MGLLGLVPLVSVMILSEPRHVRCIYMYIYIYGLLRVSDFENAGDRLEESLRDTFNADGVCLVCKEVGVLRFGVYRGPYIHIYTWASAS